jgi:hypothetical protein
VDDWLVGLIAAAGAVGGSAVTGIIAFRLARLEREARDKDELRAALVAYGAAVDRLTLKIAQLPQAHGIEEGWGNMLIARWPTLDWTIGRLSLATVGRSAMRAVEEVMAANNRLILVAPEAVLEKMHAITDLTGRFDPGGNTWKAEWQEARNALAAVSRGALIAAGGFGRS